MKFDVDTFGLAEKHTHVKYDNTIRQLTAEKI